MTAADLCDSIATKLDRALQSKATVKGADLAGITYSHPLIDRRSAIVVGGDYITTESGTGLVHTAPGHGVDDFNTGRKHGLPVLCPVDEAGTLTAEAGPFAGRNVLKDANTAIIEALASAGAWVDLLSQEKDMRVAVRVFDTCIPVLSVCMSLTFLAQR